MTINIEDTLDIRPNSKEEDKYIKMKDAYKQGKEDGEESFGIDLDASVLALDYYKPEDEDSIRQYVNGWSYAIWERGDEPASI